MTTLGRRLRELAKSAINDADEDGDPIPYRERYALLALANELLDKKGEIWTSDERIAAKIAMTPDAYYRTRTALMERGLMARIKGKGQGSRTNHYRLFPSAVAAEASSAATAEVGTQSPQSTSADTAATSASTAVTSASTAKSSAVAADISPIRPIDPRTTRTLRASASPPRAGNRSMKIVEDGEAITDGIAAAVVANIDGPPLGEDFSEDHRRAEIDRLREASSDA